jgi:uncharacterized protein YjbI with pentapeptide repeats
MPVQEKTSIEDHSKAIQLLRDLKAKKIPQPTKPLSLVGVHLAGEDLSDMDLSGVDFSQADLTEVNFSNTRLFKSNFQEATLLRAKLINAELSGANFTSACLEEVDAQRAGLGMSNLSQAQLFNANLENATLSMANLEGADLRNVKLRKARIRESNLRNTDFTNADLREVDISFSDVFGGNFNDANMQKMQVRLLRGFENADWIGVDVRDVNFAGAYRLHRYISDQNYIEEFKSTSRSMKAIYYIWWFTSDCGRSLLRWAVWIFLLCVLFAYLFTFVDVDYGSYETKLSPLYFSFVTLTTLGYGDVIPASLGAQILSMTELTIGYMMLGGLLSILSNKIARRAD